MFYPRHWRSGADETSREIRTITSQEGRCVGIFSELEGGVGETKGCKGKWSIRAIPVVTYVLKQNLHSVTFRNTSTKLKIALTYNYDGAKCGESLLP